MTTPTPDDLHELGLPSTAYAIEAGYEHEGPPDIFLEAITELLARIDKLAAAVEERTLERLVLPGWFDLDDKLEAEWSPLDRFIHDNEPAGMKDETAFRVGLQELLDWAIGLAVRDQKEA